MLPSTNSGPNQETLDRYRQGTSFSSESLSSFKKQTQGQFEKAKNNPRTRTINQGRTRRNKCNAYELI